MYGPAFTLVSAGIGRLFRASPAATIQAFKLLSALALAGATLLAAAACRKMRPDRTALTVALIALNPVLVVHTVGGGHSDALAALLLAGALWCVSRPVTGSGGAMGRSERFGLEAPALSATVLLALASSIKVALVVGLVVWLWVTLRRAGRGRWLVAGAAHLGLAVAAGAAVAAPLWAGRETFGSLETLGSLEGWASGVRLVARGSEAVARAVAGRSAEATADHLTRAVFYVVFAAAVVWMLERARPPSIGHAAGASLLLLALAIPILLPWYSAWFILFLPFRLRQPRRPESPVPAGGELHPSRASGPRAPRTRRRVRSSSRARLGGRRHGRRGRRGRPRPSRRSRGSPSLAG